MILALDLGSTSFKATAFDEGLNAISSGEGTLVYRYGERGEIELEVKGVFSALKEAVLQAVAGLDDPNASIDAVAVTSQAQTFTLLQGNGKPKMPFISWRDVRAVESAREWTQVLPAFKDQGSFYEALPYLLSSQLHHLSHHGEPGIDPEDRVALLPTMVTKGLSGGFFLDENLAAMTGLYSLSERSWWKEALSFCGLDASQLPSVVPVGSVACQTNDQALEAGLPAGVPIVLAGNDQTAGAFAARLEEQRSTLITLGTCQVAYRFLPSVPPSKAQLIRGPYPGGNGYWMAADSCGGDLVNWACTVLAGCSDPRAFFEKAEQAEARCKGLTFEASVSGSAGSWQGIGFQHGVPEFSRAVLEALVERMDEMFQRLEVSSSSSAPVLVAGGGSQSSLWRQLLRDKLGRDLTPTSAQPALGAARMASEALARS